MRPLNQQPLRRQIVWGAAIILLPLAVMIGFAANQTRLERQREVRNEAVWLATSVSAYMDQYLNGLDSVASALVSNPLIIDRHPTESRRVFASVLRDAPLLLDIVLTDATGAPIASGRSKAPQARDWYARQVIAANRAAIGTLSTPPEAETPTLPVAYPVHDASGAVVGALGLAINLLQLQTVFAGLTLPEGSVVTITDESQRVLVRSHDAEKFIGSAYTATPTDPTRFPRTEERVGLDGIDRFYGNALVTRAPWFVSVGIPRTIVVSRLMPLFVRNFLIVGLASVASLLISLWIARHAVRHLDHLRGAAQRIAAGDLTPPARLTVPNLELSQLQDAFITMAANLRDARDALARQIEQERKTGDALQSLKRQVVRQERLAAVGVLVSGVAHELNNPLQAILGTAEILDRDPAMPDTAREDIAVLLTQTGRAKEIIRSLSRFSSQQAGPPATIDVRDVLDEVMPLRRGDLKAASIAAEVVTLSHRKVYANFTEIAQVILNFVINAQQSIEDAAPTSGRILIKLFDAGKKVRLEVSDNGSGVKPEDEAKLFQPFFTTKPVGKGTGLGLSVSYGIIDSCGGAIGYRGNEWGGATFFFELPAIESAVRT